MDSQRGNGRGRLQSNSNNNSRFSGSSARSGSNPQQNQGMDNSGSTGLDNAANQIRANLSRQMDRSGRTNRGLQNAENQIQQNSTRQAQRTAAREQFDRANGILPSQSGSTTTTGNSSGRSRPNAGGTQTPPWQNPAITGLPSNVGEQDIGPVTQSDLESIGNGGADSIGTSRGMGTIGTARGMHGIGRSRGMNGIGSSRGLNGIGTSRGLNGIAGDTANGTGDDTTGPLGGPGGTVITPEGTRTPPWQNPVITGLPSNVGDDVGQNEGATISGSAGTTTGGTTLNSRSRFGTRSNARDFSNDPAFRSARRFPSNNDRLPDGVEDFRSNTNRRTDRPLQPRDWNANRTGTSPGSLDNQIPDDSRLMNGIERDNSFNDPNAFNQSDMDSRSTNGLNDSNTSDSFDRRLPPGLDRARSRLEANRDRMGDRAPRGLDRAIDRVDRNVDRFNDRFNDDFGDNTSRGSFERGASGRTLSRPLGDDFQTSDDRVQASSTRGLDRAANRMNRNADRFNDRFDDRLDDQFNDSFDSGSETGSTMRSRFNSTSRSSGSR
jgi:hypothetical protein